MAHWGEFECMYGPCRMQFDCIQLLNEGILYKKKSQLDIYISRNHCDLISYCEKELFSIFVNLFSLNNPIYIV